MDDFDRRSSYTRRQSQLLAAALRLLDREGIAGFTMRSLADETGLSPMAAYKHFENQRALQIELWRSCHDHFYDRLLEATDDAADPAVAFLRMCEAFMRYSVDHPYRYELLFNHPFIREVQQDADLEARRVAVVEFARDLLDRARDLGLFRSDISIDLLLAGSVSQVRGMAGTFIYSSPSRLGDIPVEDFIASSLEFIRGALLPR